MTAAPDTMPRAWVSPLTVDGYDRRPGLDAGESRALAAIARNRTRWPKDVAAALGRLTAPIEDVLEFVAPRANWWARSPARGALLLAMHEEQSAFWGWDRARWAHVLEGVDPDVRQLVLAVAYLLCGHDDLHREIRAFKRGLFARRVFGAAVVDQELARVQRHLDGYGYAATLRRPGMMAAAYELMLAAGSPLLEDLAREPAAFVALRARERPAVRYGVAQLAAAMEAMGILERSPLTGPDSDQQWLARSDAAARDVPELWAGWVARWFCTSTLTASTRRGYYYLLCKAGRWIARQDDPGLADPGGWRRQHAIGWIAAVDRMLVGELSNAPYTAYLAARKGGPLTPRTKSQHITALRVFFADLQEWELIERHFDPHRTLQVPRSIRALIGPDPRVIPDDAWAKLLWAGLNLTETDLPTHATTGGQPWYPLELVKAMALLWLFGGLRNDEILRLRVGAIRWQNDHRDGEQQRPVCLLDVPTNKTGTSFTKPVDDTVGDAIDAWHAARPAQPRFVDPKTGETVDLLFAYRGARVGAKYLNRVLIALLCEKAGVPRTDVRGPITSHRARATIASQLYNAKDPMSLFELQAWLGHRSPESTQHYARITPTTLARAYTDAGYFQRNLRTIEVLLDRDAVTTGAATAGEPFEFYDLGHGYCTYTFFEQCPHRMACARCDFYLPKQSSQAQLLEAKAGIQHMLVEIPLTDNERAAAEGDQTAIDRLLDSLADTPTPSSGDQT